MTNTKAPASIALDQLAARLRPKLLRYAARMTGSVIDGEDVVQDALLKAHTAAPHQGLIAHPDAWLFRITHNTALDFLRRRVRQANQLEVEALMIPDSVDEVAQRQAAAAGFAAFMGLTTVERSSVILMDVLGHSLREVAEVTALTIPSIKAALHRGRGRLRNLVEQSEDQPPLVMSAQDRALLTAYIERFNARDFDAVRTMIADDVRLDLVGRARMHGRAEVGQYFGNYAGREDWNLSLGFIDRRPAIFVRRPLDKTGAITHIVLLGFEGQRITDIRDYRYATHVVAEAEILPVAP